MLGVNDGTVLRHVAGQHVPSVVVVVVLALLLLIPPPSSADASASASAGACIDNDERLCPVWAESGECTANARYMLSQCPRSCGVCTGRGGTAIPPQPTGSMDGGGDGDDDDRSSKCRLFMAESTVPHAGLGVYTAADLDEGDAIPGPSDLVVQLTDVEYNDNLKRRREHVQESDDHYHPHPHHHVAIAGLLDILNSYVWDATVTRGSYDALTSVHSLSPGLGMLANAKPGFTNIELGVPTVGNGGLHRDFDAGAGSISAYHNRTAVARRRIRGGTELLVQYGDDWFEGRPGEFGGGDGGGDDDDDDDARTTPPLDYEYNRADRILDGFFRLVEKVSNNSNNNSPSPPDGFENDLWDLLQLVLRNERVRSILPSTVDGARLVHGGPLALQSHTEEEVVRSTDWLEQNGTCLDNIYSGQSTVTGAGRGAFARRDIAEGEIIAPAPVIQLHRQALEMYYQDATQEIDSMGYQLLMNYCFGHRDSSILLFPYSPGVSFVNHGDGDGDDDDTDDGGKKRTSNRPNAYVRWSDHPHHRREWLDMPVGDVLAKGRAGLMLEFVALRPIYAGDEILLDYGQDWTHAWREHGENWEPPITTKRNHDGGLGQRSFMSASAIDVMVPVVFTVDEQKERPYPSHAMTACHVVIDDYIMDGSEEKKVRWVEPSRSNWLQDPRPCDIVSRTGDEFDEDSIRYTARVRVDRVRDATVMMSGIPRRAITFVDRNYAKDQYLRGAFRHEIGLPDDIFPEEWKDLRREGDVPQKCGLYMAESSIPNSGLGMYTAVAIKKYAPIFYPDVVVQQCDHDWNQKERKKWNRRAGRPEKKRPKWLLHSYYWEARNTLGIYDGEEEMMSIVPGLGMLANSHTGLVNALMQGRPTINTAGIHRSVDPGAGAFSAYHKLTYEATTDIPPGMELFVEYGDDWFEDREAKFGPIPLSDDFIEADDIMKKFFRFADQINHPEFAKDLWSVLYDYFLDHKRLEIALPAKFEDARHVFEIGTAMASVPNAIRSPEWLAENGLCLDNIREDVSTVRQAGRGAFATRSIGKGSVIAPAPLVHIHRRHLKLMEYFKNDDRENDYKMEQLLLNYCYGHQKSSLLLFPYAPVVNFINHNGDSPNAYIRWSSLPNHQSELMNLSVEDLMKVPYAGLILEFVAFRDISPGEEVFIDYGRGWSKSWKAHVQDWRPVKHARSYISAAELNDRNAPFLTEDEQKQHPYPKNVTIVCYVKKGLKKSQEATDGPFGEQREWQYEFRMLHFQDDFTRPCKILSRDEEFSGLSESIRPLNVTYTARVKVSKKTSIVVRKIPPRAIEFVDVHETKDQYLRNAFRHEIEIPDRMFPKAWMDLIDETEQESDDLGADFLYDDDDSSSGDNEDDSDNDDDDSAGIQPKDEL